MMIMYVHHNTSDDEVDAKGALADIAKSAFWTKDGLPVFFTKAELDTSHLDYQDNVQRPTPGMVGQSMRGDKTFVVAADGDVYAVDLGWPTLQSYAKAVQIAAGLERRLELMLKEFLTEEAAIGLIQYVIADVTGISVSNPGAEEIFKEFKAKQRDADA